MHFNRTYERDHLVKWNHYLPPLSSPPPIVFVLYSLLPSPPPYVLGSSSRHNRERSSTSLFQSFAEWCSASWSDRQKRASLVTYGFTGFPIDNRDWKQRTRQSKEHNFCGLNNHIWRTIAPGKCPKKSQHLGILIVYFIKYQSYRVTYTRNAAVAVAVAIMKVSRVHPKGKSGQGLGKSPIVLWSWG